MCRGSGIAEKAVATRAIRWIHSKGSSHDARLRLATKRGGHGPTSALARCSGVAELAVATGQKTAWRAIYSALAEIAVAGVGFWIC